MKPNIVLCLGNSLMGDDGVACVVAERISADRRLMTHTDVTVCGTDLLRAVDVIAGRKRVFVVDAKLDDCHPGTVAVHKPSELSGDASGERHAHGLSPLDTLDLVRSAAPGDPEVTLLTISVRSARVGDGLSPELMRELPRIAERLTDILALACPGDSGELCGPMPGDDTT